MALFEMLITQFSKTVAKKNKMGQKNGERTLERGFHMLTKNLSLRLASSFVVYLYFILFWSDFCGSLRWLPHVACGRPRQQAATKGVISSKS